MIIARRPDRRRDSVSVTEHRCAWMGRPALRRQEQHHFQRQHRGGRPRAGRRPRTHQVLRPGAGGHRPELHRRAGHGHRLPRPQRRRQDHDPADAARPDARPTPGTATFNGAPLRDLPEPAPHRRRRPRDAPSTRPAPGRNHLRVYCRAAGLPLVARRRGAGPGRARRRRQPARRRLLPRHAPAARAGDRPARRPRRPGARRAGQRPGPRGHPVAARLPPAPRPRRRAARCSSPATCCPRSSRPSTAWSSSAPGRLVREGSMAAAPRPAPTAPARCSSAAPRPPGSPTCCAPTARRSADRTAARSPSPGRRRPRSARRAFAAGIELHELRARDQRPRGDLLPAHRRARSSSPPRTPAIPTPQEAAR